MCLGHSWSTSSTVTLGGQSHYVFLRFPSLRTTWICSPGPPQVRTASNDVKMARDFRGADGYFLGVVAHFHLQVSCVCSMRTCINSNSWFLGRKCLGQRGWVMFISFHCLILSNFAKQMLCWKRSLGGVFFSDVDYCSRHIKKNTSPSTGPVFFSLLVSTSDHQTPILRTSRSGPWMKETWLEQLVGWIMMNPSWSQVPSLQLDQWFRCKIQHFPPDL